MATQRVLGICTALLGIVFPSWAWGAGIWNMPTTARQYVGVGFGAGYHAPLVVGPAWRVGPASPGVERTRLPILRSYWASNFHPTAIHSAEPYGAPLQAGAYPAAPMRHPGVGFSPPELVLPHEGGEVYYPAPGEFNRP